jgi:hypothetical protein
MGRCTLAGKEELRMSERTLARNHWQILHQSFGSRLMGKSRKMVNSGAAGAERSIATR